MRQKVITGVLHNFLSSYVSRNSDYDGYCLFGLIVRDFEEMQIDLLNSEEELDCASPVVFAKRLAGKMFREQIQKAGLTMSGIREAHLHMIKSPKAHNAIVNDLSCSVFGIRFIANVVTVTGKAYKKEVTEFVAPNDYKVERRSTRRLSED